MTTSDQIGSSHVEAMNKIAEFISTFNVDKLLYAISTKRFDEDTIRSITLDIREQNVKLERQREYLFSFGRVFNKEYTTSDNKCFDTSARLAFKMRSGIKGIKTSVKKFCMKSRRRLPAGGNPVQAIDRSLIAAEEYNVDLFGLESFPACVLDLFHEMSNFFKNVYDCLEESLRVLSEEKETRQDKRKCIELLQQACDKCKKNQMIFVEAYKKNPALKTALLNSETLMPNDNNPVLKRYMDSRGDNGTFASNHFHNCTDNDLSKITFYEIIQEAEGDDDLFICMTLFNCDKEKALQINYAISNFDSLLPEKCKRNKIPAIHLSLFKEWCSKAVGNETFLNYFKKRYKESGGKWETIGKSAISGAANKYLKSASRYESIKRKMLLQLEDLNKGLPE